MAALRTSGRPGTRFLRGLVAAASLALGAVATAPAADAPTESQLKAVFLYNFAQFVEWPAAAFPAPEAPFLICVLGTDPFGAYLDEAVAGESVQGHPIRARRHDSATGLGDCHILFVGVEDPALLAAARQGVASGPTLLVSDIHRSAEQGAIIEFFRADNRLRLRINLRAARNAGLVISSKLLRPAVLVGNGRG